MAVVRNLPLCVSGGLGFAASALLAAAAEAPPDFVGRVPFDVSSESGRVENIRVTVGDGGSGRYKAILAGEASLPTHTIYRPRDLRPFHGRNRLPVVVFANGGCRNSSGEFRNLLSEIASHGFLVAAIGPASTAAIAGSEERLGTTQASQLLDAVVWAQRENGRAASAYFGKLAPTRVAVAGQSCGGDQALDVASDPRFATVIVLNSFSALGRPSEPTATGGPLTFPPLDQMARRYTPGESPYTLDMTLGKPSRERLEGLHTPVLYVVGGSMDVAYDGAVADFQAITQVPVALLSRDVGHYPGTYRQPNGGAFAIALTAWLKWQLKGDRNARRMFVGVDCGLCRDTAWTVKTKNLQ